MTSIFGSFKLQYHNGMMWGNNNLLFHRCCTWPKSKVPHSCGIWGSVGSQSSHLSCKGIEYLPGGFEEDCQAIITAINSHEVSRTILGHAIEEIR